MSLNKPAYVLPRNVEVEGIVNIAAIAVVEAQNANASDPLQLENIARLEEITHVG